MESLWNLFWRWHDFRRLSTEHQLLHTNLGRHIWKKWDYDIDVDPDVFDIYKEEVSAEIINKIYGLLESYITERLEYYSDDYEGVSDFVEVEKLKDQNLKSQLKCLERRLFPED